VYKSEKKIHVKIYILANRVCVILEGNSLDLLDNAYLSTLFVF
jgi:hypothetical protein